MGGDFYAKEGVYAKKGGGGIFMIGRGRITLLETQLLINNTITIYNFEWL